MKAFWTPDVRFDIKQVSQCSTTWSQSGKLHGTWIIESSCESQQIFVNKRKLVNSESRRLLRIYLETMLPLSESSAYEREVSMNTVVWIYGSVCVGRRSSDMVEMDWLIFWLHGLLIIILSIPYYRKEFEAMVTCWFGGHCDILISHAAVWAWGSELSELQKTVLPEERQHFGPRSMYVQLVSDQIHFKLKSREWRAKTWRRIWLCLILTHRAASAALGSKYMPSSSSHPPACDKMTYTPLGYKLTKCLRRCDLLSLYHPELFWTVVLSRFELSGVRS